MRVVFLIFALTLQTLSQSAWIEQVSGVPVSLNSVTGSNWFGGAWICGNNGTVLRTSNFGVNWINVTGNGIPNDIMLNTISDISFFSSGAITAGVRLDTAIVYRTTNNGANWNVVFRQYNGRINGISRSGFMVGNPVGSRWSIWKTTDDGATWDSAGLRLMQNGGETGWNNSFMEDNGRIAFGTNNSRLYYSSNNGINWLSVMISGDSNVSALSISFFGGLYYGGTSKVSYTTNLGINWQDAPVIPNSGVIIGLYARPLPVDILGSSDLFISRGDDKILFLGASGFSWKQDYTAPNGNYKDVSGGLSWRIWAVRDNGGISYCQCTLIGINPISTEIPESFSLTQNYPNPFNPTTNIKFDLPKSGLVELVVYDINGREITKLVQQQMNAGSYSADWDASGYASGVYFYSLKTNEFTLTRKLVLLK